MEILHRRAYRGPLRAIILDWAGTAVDYGSFAPVAVFVRLFAQHGVALTAADAREGMGLMKKDHLRALRSSDLEDLGLRLALQKLAQSAAARAGLDLELDLQDPLHPLRPDVEQTLYRVAQEAIENVVRHAQAKKTDRPPLSRWTDETHRRR